MAMRTTFIRNGAGWSFGPNRSLIKRAADIIRDDYDKDKNQVGALVERQSTNNFLHSIDLNNWAKIKDGNASLPALTAGATAAPDGTMTASRVVFDQSGGTYSLIESESVASEKVAITSFWAKSAINETQKIIVYIAAGLDREDGGVIDIGTKWSRINIIHRALSGVDKVKIGLRNSRFNTGNNRADVCLWGLQHEFGTVETSLIPTAGNALTRAADFFDAPGPQNADTYGPGIHTWRNAVRMSRDPGEPTIISSAEHRIYASNGRLHLDGPGELIQPDGEHAPGDYVPFIWNVQFPGAAPDFALGREYGDANWWNGHLVDIVPFPRKLSQTEINAWVGA